MKLRNAGLFWGSVVLLVACGSSRPTQRNCSKTNAVFQSPTANSPSTYRAGEERDPSAAVLLFKATSSKIAIESRCNARLMHQLRVLQSDGRPPQQPINFNNLRFDISNDTGMMELHSSNHCFFRVWDPRVDSQVKNNPSLGVEPVKSLLSDPLNRYHLYRSLLTTPQKLVVFASNGTPVEFEYRFSGQEIYQQFFQKIDNLASDTYRRVVGREFSKTSVFLDELALDVCGAQEKLLQRMDDSPGQNRRTVTDLFTFATYFKGNQGFIAEPYRRSLMTSGRNKTCISQTDFVVVPIKFTGELSAAQKAATTEIFNRQNTDANSLKSKLEKIYQDPLVNINDSIPEMTPSIRFRELNAQEPGRTNFIDSLKVPRSCTTWIEQYPGLMLTAPVGAIASSKVSRYAFKSEQFSTIEAVTRKIFPSLANDSFQNPLAPVILTESLNMLLRAQECNLKGFQFEDSVTTPFCKDGSRFDAEGKRILEVDWSMGACPPEDEFYRIYAAKIHLNTVASMRLSMASTILNLERYREKHKESLFLPLAQFRDGTGGELFNMSSQNDKSVFTRVKKILDEMDGEYAQVTKFYDSLRVDSISPELELRCTPSTRAENANNPAAVDVGFVFDTLSPNAKTLLNAGFTKPDSFRYYLNFASRYLMIRCLNASSQLLLTNFSKAQGLYQFFRDARLSFVASDNLPSEGDIGLSTQALIETGRPVQIPFQKFIIAESALKDLQNQQQTLAYLLGEGHIELSYCNSQSSKRRAELEKFCAFDLVNPNFLTYYKNRFPNEFGAARPLALFDPAGPGFSNLVSKRLMSENPTPEMFAQALPVLFAHLNVLTAIPRWYPQKYKDSLGKHAYPNEGFHPDSGMYALGPGDSGTTISLFGLFPVFMVSTVNDVPVSGGLAVIPSTGGQDIQPKGSATCR